MSLWLEKAIILFFSFSHQNISCFQVSQSYTEQYESLSTNQMTCCQEQNVNCVQLMKFFLVNFINFIRKVSIRTDSSIKLREYNVLYSSQLQGFYWADYLRSNHYKRRDLALFVPIVIAVIRKFIEILLPSSYSVGK